MIELKGKFSPVKVLKGNINTVSVGLASGMIPIPSTAEVGQILSVLAVDDEKKLTAVEAIDKPETPLFDLTSAGLPAITPDGVPVELETDTTEILAAVSKGAVVFKLNAQLGGEVIPANIVGTCICSTTGEETASVICPFVMDELGFVLLSVYPQRIEAVYMPHSVIAGSGVTSWNDLADRPFGEEGIGEPEMLIDETLSFGNSGMTGVYLWQAEPAPFSLVAGEFYYVVWDDVGHNCTAFTAILEGKPCVGIGNPALAGLGESTNEKFLVGVFADGSAAACFTTEPGATHTVWIVHGTQRVKTLDAKYLPMDVIDERIEAKLAEMPDVSEVGM